MRPQDLPYPRVSRLYRVRGRAYGPARREPLVEEGEQGSRPAQALEAPPRLSQALVLVLGPAVHDGPLAQEALPPGAPARERCEPLRRPVGVGHRQQVPGYAVELGARLELRPRGRAALDLAERVEHAPLHARVGPPGAPRLLYPSHAIADEHVGRRDPPHEEAPVQGALRPGEMAADDVVVRPRDEQHRAPAEPDAVRVDDVVYLVAYGQHRPDGPESRGPRPERPGRHAHLRLGALPEQPVQEERQVLGCGVVGLRGGCAAGLAAPSRPPRTGTSVALRIAPARRALHLLHPAIELRDFKKLVFRN